MPRAKPDRTRAESEYLRANLVWHVGLRDSFDPLAVVRQLADSLGLVMTESKSKRTGRVSMRIDSRSSLKARRGGRSLVDKPTMNKATTLLRRALRDPEAAAAIASLVDRANAGEEVTDELVAAITRSQQPPG